MAVPSQHESGPHLPQCLLALIEQLATEGMDLDQFFCSSVCLGPDLFQTYLRDTPVAERDAAE